MIHKIKLQKGFCDAVLEGKKNFEIRYNDRGYQAGDYVEFISMDGECFQAYHDIDKKRYEITYVLSGWGIKENYVVFGIKEVEKGGNE